ncbi:MAG: transcriptional regulator, TetR family [Anaerocolumna sp.]|jgi:AcrR family transcriptional regulator|nr:transcriptional regulator, TetR family [Anaerocolumna sp.]
MPKIYDDLRETIVQEAKSIIVSRGYSKLNMREVAKASGIAVGTIYNYYPTKNDLLSELMYRYWMGFIAAIQQLQQSDCELFVIFRKIYNLLESFLDTFKDTWLKVNEKDKGLAKDHHKQKQEVMDLFIDTLEQFIHKHKLEKGNSIKQEVSDRELAIFVVQNFILIAQMRQIEYDTFEMILKSYLH